MYEQKGFEVLIGHRMFNPKENYEPRLIRANEEEGPGLVLPKKTGHFLKYWAGEPDNINNYKV